MELLRELVNIVAKNKVRTINVIGDDSFQSDSQLNLLYDAILDGRVRTEKDALDLFNITRNTKRFKNLKSELRQRILNTLFFVDVSKPGYTDQSRAYYTCCRRWAAMKILFSKGAYRSGIDIAKKLYLTCLEYEFTELALDISRMLSLQYGYRYGDKALFEKYTQEFEELEGCYHAENLLERHFVRFAISYLHNQEKEALRELGDRLTAEVVPYLERYDTYRVHVSGRVLLVWNALSQFDYEKVIELCDESLSFFMAKPYLARTPIGMMLHYKMLCHTQTKQYEQGRETAVLAEQYYEQGTINWFKFQESVLLLNMHTKNYQEAYGIHLQATAMREFKSVDPRTLEVWTLYGAFLEYLALIGEVEPEEESKRSRQFRLNKLLNEVPIFNGEKRRMNIPLLVLQILFLIHRDKYTAAVDRIEAIEKYCSRYLKKDGTYRSNCFIKMLLQIPQSAFHIEAVKRKAEKFYQRLLEQPLEITSQSWEVEIIPYEELWSFVLRSLDRRRVT